MSCVNNVNGGLHGSARRARNQADTQLEGTGPSKRYGGIRTTGMTCNKAGLGPTIPALHFKQCWPCSPARCSQVWQSAMAKLSSVAHLQP